MQFLTGDHLPAGCAAVIRFFGKEERIAFRDPQLQSAWDTCFTGDSLTIPVGGSVALRIRMGYRFAALLAVRVEDGEESLYRAALKAGMWLQQQPGEIAYAEAAPGMPVADIARGLSLCDYRFDRYLTAAEPVSEKTVTVRTASPDEEQAVHEGALLADCVKHARDMVNDIAEHMTPERLAETAAELGRQYGFETEIHEKAECERLGMGLFLSVARGSELPPRLIVLRLNGDPGSERCIGFVGKGITYDSGGYNIKTSSMEKMRFDMNGAAAVIGAFCAMAAAGLRINAVAVIAACENMVDARSFRSGDVFRAMDGRTVYVRNTDAEGRLTMADAITYCIRRFKPTELIECAGLTGSVCSFYGSVCAATLPTDVRLHERIASLTPITHERYAMMPSFPEYRKLLRTPIADLNSAPEGPCGGITAALFLCEFAEQTPFISIDFGAMPFTSRASDGQPEGATGFGVCTLYQYMKHRALGTGIWADEG